MAAGQQGHGNILQRGEFGQEVGLLEGQAHAAAAVEGPGFGALGYGFSDAVFLGRRSEFARPIYRERCLISLRYPLSHIAADFEQRVDSYMRRHRRLRATHTGVIYYHPENVGVSYPKPARTERLKRLRNHLIFRLLGKSHLSHPCLRA